MSSNNHWEYLDFMSAEPRLYIKGKYRYKTKFGLIMSILSFVPVVVLSIILFKVYFDKLEVNILFLQDRIY